MSPLEGVGLACPRLLLPVADVAKRWCVPACDQFVHQPEVWRSLDRRRGSVFSALDLVLPECDLDAVDLDAVVGRIHAAMKSVLDRGVLQPAPEGWRVVRRRFPSGSVRCGLLVAFDLESCFDDRPGPGLVSTEELVEERMAARTRLREGARLEIPHLVALCDDPEGILAGMAASSASWRDFHALPEGAGEVCGGVVDADRAEDGLRRLRARSVGSSWFVGDGNHSLQAALRVWGSLRRRLSGDSKELHPARFAVGELQAAQSWVGDLHPVWRRLRVPYEELRAAAERAGFAVEVDASLADGRFLALRTPDGSSPDPWTASSFLDSLGPEVVVEYLHGREEAVAGEDPHPRMAPWIPDLEGLLAIFRAGRRLPRKSFSLGRPHEKRFYLEARRLF